MHVRCFSLHIDLSLKYCSITYWLTVEWAKGPGRKIFSMPLTEREQRDPCTIAEGQIISRQTQPDSVNKPFIIWPLRFFVSPLDPDGSEHFGLFLVSLCLVIFLYIYHCHIYHFIFEGCHVPNLFSISQGHTFRHRALWPFRPTFTALILRFYLQFCNWTAHDVVDYGFPRYFLYTT